MKLVSILLTISTIAVASTAHAGESARGVVFEDRNSNGKRDAGEPGVAKVAVSNQHDVVLTDANGQYTIPVTDDTIIFVSRPSGYDVPVNENMLPQFFYIHKPNGSPKLQYGGVAPTGPLPESVDFPLIKSQQSDKFRAVVMADPQVETSQEIQYARDDVLSELVGIDAEFSITLGDIVSDRLSLYGGYVAAVGKTGIPAYMILGNHDENYDAANDRDSDETFCRFFGPNYYSWNYGKVHFVALDSIEWLGAEKGRYRGYLGKEQLAWLANDLSFVPDDRLIVLLMHAPVWTVSGRDCGDKQDLFDLLKDRTKIFAMAGHTHIQEHTFFDPEFGWKGKGAFHQLNIATVSGCWWGGPKDIRGIPVADNRDGVPNGYTIVTFDGSEYTTEFKPARLDRDFQMRIYPPGSTGIDELARRSLLVNVFDGSDRCKVEYSIDGAPFAEMQQKPQLDPLATAILSGPLHSSKPWAIPTVAGHMWSVELPERPAWGTHVVTIRVTDHFGRVRERSQIFVR